MATFAHTAVQPNRAPDLKIPARRVSLFDLFQQHVSTLSELPGGISQFDQTDIGFEWHCECEIGAGTAGERSLRIHFHLIELEPLPKPAAVLYLVEDCPGSESQSRLPLPLENMAETHEQLNEHLMDKRANVQTFEKAGNFIVALSNVRALLSGEVAWV